MGNLETAKTCQAPVALRAHLASWESMNSYHPLQSRAASQEPEVLPKLRFGRRKVALCWWFSSLTSGSDHFCLTSCFAAHQISKVLLESCVSMIFFLHLKNRLPALKCIPCWQKRGNILHTLISPICLCLITSIHVQITSQKYRALQGGLIYPFEYRQTALHRCLPGLFSEP